MEVSSAGFKRFVLEEIILQVQQTARIDVHMTVGEVAESVTVTADIAGLETENATLLKQATNCTNEFAQFVAPPAPTPDKP